MRLIASRTNFSFFYKPFCFHSDFASDVLGFSPSNRKKKKEQKKLAKFLFFCFTFPVRKTYWLCYEAEDANCRLQYTQYTEYTVKSISSLKDARNHARKFPVTWKLE